jgi:hypothetical protein
MYGDKAGNEKWKKIGTKGIMQIKKKNRKDDER